MSGDSIIRGRVTPDGRLVTADAPLAALQAEAGGIVGGPLVVPALAHLTRTALRLGVTIARPVSIVSGASDIALWARMKPDADGVDLTLIEWEERPRAPDPVDAVALGTHAELARDGWIWHVDASLQFRIVDANEAATGHAPPRAGEPLSAYFRLLEAEGIDTDPSERLPLLAAVAARRPFSRQPALLRADPTIRYSLAALPTFDALGRLTGYRGKAIPEAAEDAAPARPATQDESTYSPLFSRRLDNALRQPLGRIIANANTISHQLEGPLRADYASYAADIAEAGRHLVELVDDLSDLQAIERPDFAVAHEEVDVADLGRRAAGLLKMRAAERQILIEAPQADETMLATAEYRRVLQILVNLIGNAVRYSPDGSHIWVRMDDDPATDRVRVIVADQGRGIDPADQERIFERFERLTPQDNAGSGLGLYISRRLARAMGGDIRVESALGQGSRFMLSLPRWTGG
ncbi:HAMP domain-containing histidine kinase [Sphingobium sufflavum]|uniref:sensor histidine kinase n=1 Tax=Sphingobium sufflavum TaxID=1129547 RepID=UPI001F28AC38|nr:HAMP domain-containing sensor histidine kinase [Sphingobium sufflavum]MCE7796948.1 HAMP domain-containing histidine kinase [Sphingobium sufflavum]